MIGDKTIGIIGAGSMSEALIRGLCNSGVSPSRVIVTNRSNRDRLEDLSRRFGVGNTTDKAELVGAADVIVIAVKPKDVPDLLREMSSLPRPGQVIISVAAGVQTAFIEERISRGTEVIRAMPNTSCLVKESATAISSGASAGDLAEQVARAVFASVGKVVVVPEAMLDAVTGLSGSGPAYVYLMIEAMVEAGERMGLTRDVSRILAVQTVFGAAKMLKDTGESPEYLRRRVTSPGGTTMAGLEVLAEKGFPQAVIQAIWRATERSQELGRALMV
ncbi:MAG: pyrroline-5-carboxylate reductase [Actinobacteria bacterium]|nr:pyrroline-5-carboxylate reductase [Actinomycetota bacterium]